MSKKFLWSLSLVTLALCVASLPAMAGSQTLYSNLGPSGNTYQCCTGWAVTGTGSIGVSFTQANEFTAMASGSVSTIDIGIGFVGGFGNSFYAALYTVGNDGNPGTLLDQWNNLSSSTQFGQCCGLVTISGISGLNLTGGMSYFLVLGPTDINDNTYLAWNYSNSATGVDEFSTDGGHTWTSNGNGPIGAFDILGGGGGGTTPEPSSLLLLGTGLVGAFGSIRRKLKK